MAPVADGADMSLIVSGSGSRRFLDAGTYTSSVSSFKIVFMGEAEVMVVIGGRIEDERQITALSLVTTAT